VPKETCTQQNMYHIIACQLWSTVFTHNYFERGMRNIRVDTYFTVQQRREQCCHVLSEVIAAAGTLTEGDRTFTVQVTVAAWQLHQLSDTTTLASCVCGKNYAICFEFRHGYNLPGTIPISQLRLTCFMHQGFKPVLEYNLSFYDVGFCWYF